MPRQYVMYSLFLLPFMFLSLTTLPPARTHSGQLEKNTHAINLSSISHLHDHHFQFLYLGFIEEHQCAL